jgi:hypothetical protein
MQSKTPSGESWSGGVLCSLLGTIQGVVPSHEEGISLPSKSIAVCSISDSGTLPQSEQFAQVRLVPSGVAELLGAFLGHFVKRHFTITALRARALKRFPGWHLVIG